MDAGRERKPRCVVCRHAMEYDGYEQAQGDERVEIWRCENESCTEYRLARSYVG